MEIAQECRRADYSELLKEPRELDDGTSTVLDFSTSEEIELHETRSSAASAHSSTGKTTAANWYSKAQSNWKIASLDQSLCHKHMDYWLALGVICLSMQKEPCTS